MKKRYTPEQKVLFEQLERIAEGLGQTFAPFCEVVVHDLLAPQNAVRAIYNNLSGRKVGAPATELGQARIADPDYPQVIPNYANVFEDGRQVKSTSIGIKDSTGKFVATLCLNVDMSIFHSFRNVLDQFANVDSGEKFSLRESLQPASGETIRARIDTFAACLATTPRALTTRERRILLRELKDAGCLDLRKAMDTVANHLGISRASAYNYLK